MCTVIYSVMNQVSLESETMKRQTNRSQTNKQEAKDESEICVHGYIVNL